VSRVAVFLTAATLASLLVAPGQAGTRSLTFTVKLVQEQTLRHHIGRGHANDTFSTTLKLSPLSPASGCGTTPCAGGTMRFEWGPLDGVCRNAGAGYNGTTAISTNTRLPGGTIIAGGRRVSLARGIVVPIRSGTGLFRGARGEITIAPAWAAKAVFTLSLPA
jgi:hypothetical protein